MARCREMAALHPRAVFQCIPLIVLVALQIAGITGCGRHQSAEQPGSKGRSYSFGGIGNPHTCESHCIRFAMYLASAELGVGKSDLAVSAGDEPAAIFRLLKEKAKSGGGDVDARAVESVLDELKAGPTTPIILPDDAGHLYMILGALDVGKGRLYQLVHGDSAVSLVSKEQLLEAGFRQAWRLASDSDGAVMRVGSGLLRVQKVYHNFGEVAVDEKLECSFTLSNAGKTLLIVGKPITSCHCTTSLVKKVDLQPGESTNVAVTQKAAVRASQRQSLIVPVFQKGSSDALQVELYTIASQRESMQVVPGDLDFGTVIPGKSYTRTLVLREAATDRFSILEFKSGALDINHEVKETKDAAGLSTYRVTLRLDVADQAPGPSSGEIRLKTDSRTRPNVIVPVKFEIPPPVSASPSVVSLGTTEIGKVRNETVQLLARKESILNVSLSRVPDDCSVRVDETSNPMKLIITTKLTQPGVWQRTITIAIKTSTGKEMLDIRCVGYGRKAS